MGVWRFGGAEFSWLTELRRGGRYHQSSLKYKGYYWDTIHGRRWNISRTFRRLCAIVSMGLVSGDPNVVVLEVEVLGGIQPSSEVSLRVSAHICIVQLSI